MIKFTTHAIKYEGGKTRVHYSKGGYTKESGLNDDVITIYAKDYSGRIPKELKPENSSDMQTDYFETDRARVNKNSPHYNDVLKAFKQAKEKEEKLIKKRALKYGW